ncbi:hypothetical protein NIES4075_69740 [Tolypothrix sp. NIES-4075]|uniref:hypothetical protein n=1 Tax=Tolypothrix sp. NIES-4075 TaxID=2005459 RepID=UPI000B735066|nr:hypothetical protein [Tolypothrix sp. NIES-4075]GAX45953.1 hypothetical protein NIES4075_69740 [Tolypothrix sp. NIES-4075]
MTQGKLEITIKINELPQAKTLENGWQQFEVDCDSRIISVTLKPKVWKKLTDAQANYPQWVGAIASEKGLINWEFGAVDGSFSPRFGRG